MGKDGSWITSEGLANRADGLKHKESKERKICMCVFWAVCFVVYLVFGSIHVSRAVNAEKINKDYNQFNLISSTGIK